MARRGNNEGTIYKRENGTWRAQISIDGKRLGHTAKTRAECTDWLRKTQNLVEVGMTFQKSEYTVEQFLTEWIEIKKSSLRPKTANQYQRIVNKDLIPSLGDKKLFQLRLNDINKYYANLVSRGRGTRTIRLIHSIFHSALEHAIKAGLISRNPSHGAILPRREFKEMRIFNEEQVNTFLICARGSRFMLLYQMALATGMRQSELLGLKWSDINWQNETIKVQRQAQVVRGRGIVFIEPKTRNGIRQIVLGNSILQKLRKHRQEQELLKNENLENWEDNNLIFTTRNGTPFSQRNLLRDFHKILEKAKLPKIRFHDLRHTAASLMINRGIPIIVVSKILGHSKPSVTLNIYAHCISNMQHEAAKIMEEITTPLSIEIPQIKG